MMEIHHIGYLVKDISKALQTFQILGYEIVSEPIIDNDRQALMALLYMNSLRIELIQPFEKSPLEGLLKRYNNAPYHICYSCKDIEQTKQMLCKIGFFILRENEPAVLFDMRMVCFMMHRDIGLIELVDERIL